MASGTYFQMVEKREACAYRESIEQCGELSAPGESRGSVQTLLLC